ncbi:MAG: VCBS repeat-containing protein [bacterium]|nr:VCBS repeat-containing protein [bacterium]
MTFRYRPHIIDTSLEGRMFAQTALVDLDGCGRPEYILGRRGGELYVYKYNTPHDWTRHQVGSDSPSDVGGAVTDIDGDGRPDIVAGGAWYRNSGDLAAGFERFVFDATLQGVHDIAIGDIDGDGRCEVVTMSDRNDLRWYHVGADPTRRWPTPTRIGDPVHAGVALGDIDGDGHLDVVRTNVWFRNVNGDGTVWEQIPIGPNTPPPADFQPPFAFDATKAIVCDMNGDGRQDILFTDAEIPGGKIWWMENVDGDGRRWLRHDLPQSAGPRRGAYHSLQVVDIDGDGDLDVISAEMEAVGGDAPPRWYIWENVDGKGGDWQEHVILDANLGGHEIVVGDVTGNGKLDIIGKPWNAAEGNAVGGRMFVVFLEAL